MCPPPSRPPSRAPEALPSLLDSGLFLVLALGLGAAGAAATARGEATSLSLASGRLVQVGEESVDTLDAHWREVLPVARETLEDHHWQIQREDTATGRIVTRWKPLKHVLVRIFLGEVLARCVVDVTPLGPGRTRVAIRGGLACENDLAQNPGLEAARLAYAKAARDWQERLRARVELNQAHALAERARHEPDGSR